MALNPLVTKPEADLVGLDDGRTLAKFRAIDDSGDNSLELFFLWKNSSPFRVVVEDA